MVRRVMTKVIVDQTELARMFDPTQTTQLCDTSGQIIGLFVPLADAEVRIAEEGECPYSDEEIELLSRQETGRPLREIWHDLGVNR
jgi:hypothetical protein